MSRSPAPLTRDAAATLAVTAYSVAVAVGFARVFSGWSFLGDLIVVAAALHGVSFVMRRARLTGWVAIPVLGVVAVWIVSALFYRETLSGVVPWSQTWERASADLELVRDQFPTAVAPVIYGAGWAPLAALALAIVVVMADSFAFRAEARGEALVPGGVLFVFIAALGSGRMQIESAMLLVGAGVLAVVCLRALHERERGTLLSSRARDIPFALPAAVATAVCVALLAGVVGPRLPGARAEALYDTTGRGGTNLIDSPFVDIRSRLTGLGNVELFRVNADSAEYWRLITLAEFDGERFALPERPLAEVDDSALGTVAGRRIRQQFQILGLQGELVPAAADPIEASLTRATGERLGLSEQPDANTLLSPTELEPGDLFDIVSLAPTPTADDLRSAGVGNVPDEIYLGLPDDLPEVLYERTAALTAGATSPFDAALAIQNWFRDPGEFTYSLEVQSGHGSNAIESFFRTRAGYCEQFAATFAAMARAAGIPSRVAVGYTPGVPDPDEPGWFSVIGKNAHAWPELWFDGVGWLMFEPTPGRGAASASAYTGVPAQQDESGPTPVSGDGGGSGLVPQPTAPPTLADDQSGDVPTTTAPLSDGAEFPDGSGLNPNLDGFLEELDGSGGVADTGRSFPWRTTIVIVAALLVLGGPRVARRVVRARHRAHGGDEQIAAAWHRAVAAASDAGVVGRPSMTAHEWTEATADVLPVAARPMANLAEVVDQAMFAAPGTIDLDRPGSLGGRIGDDCDAWSNQIETIATDTFGTTKRLKRYFASYR